MSNTTFLDIDESLKTRNLLLPDKERDNLNQQMDELMKQFDSTPFILVQPVPGICIKSKTTSGEKIFLNICTSDKIPAPKDISDDELLVFWINDEEPTNTEPSYTIPMSIGTERMEKDKSGAPCAVFDIMINTAYFKKCREKKCFLLFTILVMFSGVTKKSGKEIDTNDYVILKNRTVMGKLQQHRIQNREPKSPQSYTPLIEEIQQSKKPTDGEVCSQNSNKMGKETDYIILSQPLEGPVDHLIALFNMPRSVSIKDIVVLMNSDRINITDINACCSYDLLLPYTVKTDSAKAYLDYNLRVLRIDISVQ